MSPIVLYVVDVLTDSLLKVKAGGGARRKGQLSSLLAEAYENREAIEQQIADGRRNRKESGTKYGEWWHLHSCPGVKLTSSLIGF